MRSLLPAVLVATLTGCSARQLARHANASAGGTLAYDVSYRRAVSTGPVGGVAHAGVKARGFAGRVGFGVDVAAGASHPGGFAWRLALSPIGVGTRVGNRGVAGIIAGVGGSGVTGRVAASLELPVEAFVTLRLGGRVALSAWLQPAWLPLSDTRADGAPDVGFVDELRAGLTVRAGREYHSWGFWAGNGYHLGLVAAEEGEARYVGVTVGYDLDIATE